MGGLGSVGRLHQMWWRDDPRPGGKTAAVPYSWDDDGINPSQSGRNWEKLITLNDENTVSTIHRWFFVNWSADAIPENLLGNHQDACQQTHDDILQNLLGHESEPLDPKGPKMGLQKKKTTRYFNHQKIPSRAS